MWSLLTGDLFWSPFDLSGSQQVALQNHHVPSVYTLQSVTKLVCTASSRSFSLVSIGSLSSTVPPIETVPYAYEVSFVPLAAVALSCAWVFAFGLVHGIARYRKNRHRVGLELDGGDEDEVVPEAKNYVESLGGLTIFAYRIVRVLACIALLSLSAVDMTRNDNWRGEMGEKANLLRIGITVGYVCCSAISITFCGFYSFSLGIRNPVRLWFRHGRSGACSSQHQAPHIHFIRYMAHAGLPRSLATRDLHAHSHRH